MRKIILSLCVFCLGASPAMASGVYYMDNLGPAMNGKTVLATPTATQVLLTTPINRTLVVVNDDAENTVFYGDSTCGVNTAQKIQPLEKVTFQGVTAGFNFYICTGQGSAEVRLVEHS